MKASRAFWLAVVLIVLAGCLTYANSLSGPFILDDYGSIVDNVSIRRLWPPASVLVPARELSTAGRPVVNLSFALNYAVGTLDVRGYHVVNIAIHIGCALLLFGIVRRTLMLPVLERRWADRSTTVAFAVALIWMLHPLQTEAVDYVTERTELLMGFFYLATVYASLRADERAVWRWLTVVACALGMASKESMATAPLMVLLFDRVFRFASLKEAWRARRVLYSGLAATGLLLVGLMWSGPRSTSTGFSTSVTPWVYLLNQTVLIVRYLWLSLWPRALVIDYGVPQALTLADVLPYAALLVILVAATTLALVRRPTLGFLGAWFIVTLAPASSIVPIATWVGAERRMYLPLAALVVLAVVAMVTLGLNKAIGSVTVAAVSIALAMGTFARNREYRSAIVLAQTVLDRYPQPRAHAWMGEELVAEGRREEGTAHLRLATSGNPRAHYALGMVMFDEGKMDEALAELREFVRQEPMLLEVLSARETIGKALTRQGKLPDAEAEFRELLRMRPDSVNAQALLADTLFRQGRFDEAREHFQEVLKVNPKNMDVLTNLGIASVALGRPDEAIALFRRVVEINPTGNAERNLARALLEKRDYPQAAEHARRAVELMPDDAVAHDEFGLALAGQGRLDEAIVELRRSLQLDGSDAETREHLAAALRARGRDQ